MTYKPKKKKDEERVIDTLPTGGIVTEKIIIPTIDIRLTREEIEDVDRNIAKKRKERERKARANKHANDDIIEVETRTKTKKRKRK